MVNDPPRLLDLFCGAGGCSVGYARAGFEVTAVDIAPMPRNPTLDLHQGDALEWLADRATLDRYDVVHASPPCQAYSAHMAHLAGPGYPRLIGPVREALRRSGKPYVIENVPGAPLLCPVMICGTGLGLRIYRHRLFESNMTLAGTVCDHTVPAMNPHNQGARAAMYAELGRGDPEIPWRREMGVEWMGRYEAREAIPPAYTEYLGKQLLAHLRATV